MRKTLIETRTAEKKLDGIMDKVLERLGSGYTVSVINTRKTNGITLNGLAIRCGGEMAGPIIYLEDEDSGKPADEVAEKVVSQYWEKKEVNVAYTVKNITDKDYVMEHVIYMLVGTEKNSELLKCMPHKELLDMSAVYVISDEFGGRSFIVRVNSQLLEKLGIGMDRLDQCAVANTVKHGILFMSLYDIANQAKTGVAVHKTGIDEADFDDELPIYVLTNAETRYGASLLLYPEILSEIAEKAGADLFILPSNIHEVIIIPNNRELDVNILRTIVRNVNRSEVEPDELLTDSVYMYRRAARSLGIA